MQIGDFHVHSTGSDGELTPNELVELAIKLKLPYICFTDHYPFPPGFKEDSRWDHFHSEKYFQEAQTAKEKYKDKIKVYFGAEFNWLEDHAKWTINETKKRDYDYCLASIHMVPINKEYLPINWTEELFLEAIDKSKGIKNLVKEYYKQARLIAQSEAFECIAHFDLIKCWNKDSKYFSDKEDWYKYEVLKTLDEISKSKISIEINTSNWRDFYPCEEQCPSLWILQEAKKRNIPITIGSDGHKKEHIGTGLERAIILAKQAGYISILKFKKRKPIQIPI